MAHVRTRTLHNPKRKLSDKQIKIFGTRSQKAALNRRMSALKAKRAAARTSRATHRQRTAKRNSGEIVTVALKEASKPNPSTRSKHVATKHRKARKPASKKHAHRKRSATRSNPTTKIIYRTRSRKNKARRNPSPVRTTTSFIMNAAYMIAGAVGSKAGTQALLGSSNTGLLGYAANLVAAFLIGKVVGMFTKNKQAENSAILGGVGQVVLRFLIDNTPYGTKLKDAGFGDYQFQSFVYPQRLADGRRSAAIAIPSAWRPQPAIMPAAVAAAKPGGLSGGRGLYSR